MHRQRPGLAAGLALVLVLALVAAGCGSDEDRQADQEERSGSDDAPTVTIEAGGEPQAGGALVYAIEAESDGWNPTSGRWAVSGHLIGSAIFDPLAAFDEAGVAQPYLAESFEHDESFTRWTIGLRDGVTFHDGTAVDAAAVARTLEAHRASALTKSTLAPVSGVEVTDERTVVVTMSTPWATFPVVLASQVGYVVAPAQLDAEGDASVRKPIGSGPFEFVNWIPDDKLEVRKYPDYWREGLPYLDEVTFRPIADQTTRLAALETGEVDLAHTTEQESIVRLRRLASRGELQVVQDPGEQEEWCLMFNNSAPPFDDVRARRAVAYAIDVPTIMETVGAGISVPARGPFVEDSFWFVDQDWPTFDLDEAKRLVEEYEADKGPLTFTLRNTADQAGRQNSTQFQEMLVAAGMDVELEFLDQSTLIGTAVSGEFQLNSWRQFGAPDPEGDYIWWHSGGELEGALNLNFARINNPDVDAALDAARETDEREERKEHYAEVQRIFAEEMPYVWISHSQWTIGASNSVRAIGNQTLPDGSAALPFGGQLNGYHRLTETWLEN